MKFPNSSGTAHLRPVCPNCKKKLHIVGIYRFKPPDTRKNIIGVNMREHKCPLCKRSFAELGIVTALKSLDGIDVESIL